jgi:hypothetical protein
MSQWLSLVCVLVALLWSCDGLVTRFSASSRTTRLSATVSKPDATKKIASESLFTVARVPLRVKRRRHRLRFVAQASAATIAAAALYIPSHRIASHPIASHPITLRLTTPYCISMHPLCNESVVRSGYGTAKAIANTRAAAVLHVITCHQMLASISVRPGFP